MALSAVVELANEHAAGDEEKLTDLEKILTGDTQHKRDQVVTLLVDSWGYRHHAVSKIDEAVATSQVNPAS